jgi:hypothetical protein
MSTVVNAANLEWVFELTSPSGTPLYAGNFSAPDVDNVAFTTFEFPDPLQQIFGQVEFSASNAYTVKVSVKDAAGVIYTLSKGQPICKPNGNVGKNNFGAALIDIAVKCAAAQLYVTDHSNLIYKSLTGTKVSTTLTLSYPTDTSGNQIPPVTVTSIPALLPILYEGEGHEVYVAHIYDYDLGDYFIVRIRYTFKKVFPVWCNVTLAPLFCEVERIATMLENGCFDSADVREKTAQLTAVNTKLLGAVVGIMEPLADMDVPAIVEDIKKDLGITCECCRPGGVNVVGTALATDANFVANVTCGDISASFDNDGMGNIVLNIGDKSYAFAVAGTTAATWSSATGGCTVTKTLTFDMAAFAYDIFTNVAGNPTLLSLFTSLFQTSINSCNGLDGGQYFPTITSGACDYTIVLNSLPIGRNVHSIWIDGGSIPAPAALSVSNAASIASWLNSLGKGTFTASYSPGNHATTINTVANTDSPSTMSTVFQAEPPVVTAFTTNCNSICSLIQQILNYLNQVDLLHVISGDDPAGNLPGDPPGGWYVCSVNPANGVIQRTRVDADDKADKLLSEISKGLCSLVAYSQGKYLTCDNIKALFSTFTSTTGNPNGADIVLMFKGGSCQQVPVKNLAMGIFGLLSIDPDVKNIYCQGALCTSVTGCSPTSADGMTVTDTTAIIYFNPVAGAISYKYSIDGGTTWGTATTAPAYFVGLTPGTVYTFMIYPVYANGPGTACTASWNFLTTDTTAACDTPTVTFSDVDVTSFTINWTAVSGASGYQYQINGGGWINAGLSFSAAVSGLAPNTLYNVAVRALMGGVPCPAGFDGTASTTTDALSANFFVGTGGTDLTVSNITMFGVQFYTIATGAYPLNEGENLTGTHGTTSGPITLNVSGSFGDAHADLVVNGVFIWAINLNAGANAFPARAYAASDSIEIVVSDGAV